MLLYHYANEPYTDLRTKQAQGKMTPEEIKEEDKYALFRHDASPSYAEISFLPDPIPLDIMGALYAGHDHHIWIPNHVVYEHIVESKDIPAFKYHISETPDDIKQMFSDWPDNPSNAEKRKYFQEKNARKWRTGENGEGNLQLEKHFGKYVNGTRKAYLAAIPMFDESNWKQYAPMVPHVQINPEGGIVQLLRPARKVTIGPASTKSPIAKPTTAQW
jgi:hypothetical protein